MAKKKDQWGNVIDEGPDNVDRALAAMKAGSEGLQANRLEILNKEQAFAQPLQTAKINESASAVKSNDATTAGTLLKNDVYKATGMRQALATTGDMEVRANNNKKFLPLLSQAALDVDNATVSHMKRVDDNEALSLKLQKLNMGNAVTVAQDADAKSAMASTASAVNTWKERSEVNPIAMGGSEAEQYMTDVDKALGAKPRTVVDKVFGMFPGARIEPVLQRKAKAKEFYNKLATPTIK